MKPFTEKHALKLMLAWEARPYSWSQHSKWVYGPNGKEEWFESYILGIRSDSNEQMEFGSRVGKFLELHKTSDFEIPGVEHLMNVPTYPIMEYGPKAKLGKIPLIGFFDGWHPDILALGEYKTSSNSSKWTQESVHEHGQLTYYAMLKYLEDKTPPEKITMTLHYIPVGMDQEFNMRVLGPHVSYQTSRTMGQVMDLMVEIQRRRKEMKKYASERLTELVGIK